MPERREHRHRAQAALLQVDHAALGHTNELKGHLRGAMNNGATLAELREVLLHVAPYAGVPASVAAFRAAGEWMTAEGLAFEEPEAAA